MSGKRGAKMLALTVALAVTFGTFAGCARGGGGAANQVIRYNLGAEPKTLDPALNSAVESGTIILNVFEGLMKLDEKDLPVPGVAEKYDVSADGLKYTFTLRKNAKWSDGQPVKASDFEYAWKRALDPATAAEYAYQLYYLKNGERYNNNQATAADVGVRAKDDYTLEVELAYPTPYFLSLMSFPTYMPIRKDMVDKNTTGWATKPETYIGNGPFKLTEWSPKNRIVLEKNANYWNAGKVKLAKVEMRMIEEATASLSAFRSGQLDYIESPPTQEIPNMVKSGEAKINPYLGTYFFDFNISDKAAAKVLQDKRVRKALTYAVDRKAMVEKITQAGQVPATTFVPAGLPINEKGTAFKNKDYYKPEGDIEAAKALLADAGFPGGAGFPTITIMYNTSQGHQNIAQFVQAQWKQNLGINVQLQNQEWAVFQTTRSKYDFDVARDGWIGDYIDPMTFLDVHTSASGQNHSGFRSAQYDKLVADAKKELDPAKRVAIMHQAEDILMEEMPIMPLYYYVNVSAIKPNVKGVAKSQLGFVFFENAYMEK